MNTREEIYAKIKELQAEGKDYDAIASTFILEVLIDIRDLLAQQLPLSEPIKVNVVRDETRVAYNNGTYQRL